MVPSDILETNDPPLESQIPALRDFISRGRVRMAVLNAKISLFRRTQSSLDKLLEERDELDVEIWMHEGSLSLIRRMPTEILSHIFAFTLPPHQPDAEPAPWTVGAVCTRWREVVISQRLFWTSIDYNSIFNHELDIRFVNRFRLNTQLSRSWPSPLNVKFTADEDWTTQDLRMLHLLSWHAPRWETVTISGPGSLYRHFKGYFPDEFPLLRELAIEMDYEYHRDVPSLDIFHNAPLLQRAVVNKSLWSCPLTMVLPWSQLLHYGGSNLWDGHLRTLRSASNLVDCSLEIQDIQPTSAMPRTPILLPRLRRLSLSKPEFLGCLDTPALLELYCDCSPPVLASQDRTPHLLTFLRRQACKLQNLVTWDSSALADPTDLTDIVEAVPTVTTLALLFPLPVEFVLDFGSRPNIAPALEYISAIILQEPTTDGDDIQHDFMQTIQSRWQSGRLKSVKVYSKELLPSILQRLELLRAQGMEVVVSDVVDLNTIICDVVPPEFRIGSTHYNVNT